MRTCWVGALLLGLWAAGAARADDPQVRVRLRTGEEVQGTLLGFTGGQFRVRTGAGERALAEADVLEVRVEPGDPGPRVRARHEPSRLVGQGEVGGIRLRWKLSPENQYVVVKAVIVERSPAGAQPAWQEVQRFSDTRTEWLDEGARPGAEYLYRVVTLAEIDPENPLVTLERLALPADQARRASEPCAPTPARRGFEARCLAASPAGSGRGELLLELKVFEASREWRRSLVRVREGQELAVGGAEPATLKQIRLEPGAQRLSAVLVHRGEELTVTSALDVPGGLLVTPAPAAAVGAQPVAAAAAIASALASRETLDLHLDEVSVAATSKLLAQRAGLNVLGLPGLANEPAPPVSLHLRGVRLGEAWQLFLATTRLEATPVGEVLCLHEPDRLRGHQPVELGPLGERRVDVDMGRVPLREALEALGVAGGADVVLSAGARHLLEQREVRLGFARLRGASLAGAVSAVCAADPLVRWTARGNVILLYQVGEHCGPEDAAASLLDLLRSYHGLAGGGAAPEVWAGLDRSLRSLLSPRLRAQSEDGFDSELGRAWSKAWKEWERCFGGPREPETLVRAGLFVQDAQGRWYLDAPPPVNRAARREVLEQAQRQADAQDWEGALRLLDQALSETPDDADALGLRAFVRGSRGDRAGARADLQRALASSPDDVRALRLLVTLQVQAGELDQAQLTADRLVALRPADPESHLLRARVHLEGQAGQNALRDVQQAQALEPGSAEALHLGAAALLQLGRLAEALPQATRLVELRPDDPAAWELRAAVLSHMGEREQARAALERAIELSPDGPQAERRRGLLKLLEAQQPPR